MTPMTSVTILHWDGGAWSLSTVGADAGMPPYLLAGTWADGSGNAWAAGYDLNPSLTAKVLHWNGSVWTQSTAGSATDVWLAGSGVYHWNGNTWSSGPPVT
jgi:hypothetical protein